MYKNDTNLKMARKYEKFVDAGQIRLAYKDIVFMDFEEARCFARSFNLHSRREWLEYWKVYKKPNNVPYDPYLRYKDIGWNGWKDFLKVDYAKTTK